MFRFISLTIAGALVLSACASTQPAAPEQPVAATAPCTVTASISAAPPDDSNADPFGDGPWFVNADRTLWLPVDSFNMGDNKFVWIRPAGARSAITGRRLDGDAPPISYFSPGGYFTGFEVGGLTIPTEGCWEVTATAGAHTLTIVVVVPASPLAGAVLAARCPSNVSACGLHAVNPRTGRDVPGYAPVDLGRYWETARSPDGQWLAVIAFPNNMSLQNGVLKFVELENWMTVTTTITFDDYVQALAFNAEGNRLAVSTQSSAGHPPQYQFTLVDVAARTILAETQLEFAARQLTFSADGSALLAYGLDNGPDFNGLNAQNFAARLSASDLAVEWTTRLEDVRDGQMLVNPKADAGNYKPGDWAWMQPAAVFAPDADRLYLVHADADKLTTVDFAARAVRTVAIEPPQSWLDRLMALTAGVAEAKVMNGTEKRAVVSPDGARLFVVGVMRDSFQDSNGDWQMTETLLGLRVVAVASGAQLATVKTAASEISLSADGRQLYLRARQLDPAQPYANAEKVWTDVLDIASLQVTRHLTDRWLQPATQLDGRPILFSSAMQPDGKFEWAALDAASLSVLFAQTQSTSNTLMWLTP